MRVFKPIILIMAVTFMALAYVHQHIELVKLSYVLDSKEGRLEHMLDHKEYLRYNIKELESPSRLERVLASRKIYTAFPKRGQVVSLANVPSTARSEEPVRTVSLKKTAYYRIFEYLGLRAEAQAREK